MAMNLKYDGTTWAVTDAQLPDYMKRTYEQDGNLRRNHSGGLRRHVNWSKWVIPMSWDKVGTAVSTHVAAIAQLADTGTVSLEYERGTFICKPEPASYSENEVSFQTYAVAITLKEV